MIFRAIHPRIAICAMLNEREKINKQLERRKERMDIMTVIVIGGATALVAGVAFALSFLLKREESAVAEEYAPKNEWEERIFEFWKRHRAPGGKESFDESVRAAEREGRSETEWTAPDGAKFVVKFDRNPPDSYNLRIDDARRVD